jgi:hypothetical protein
MKIFLIAFTLTVIATGASAQRSPRFALPDDPSVLNVRRDFGARGDGKTDDTEALQRAIDASSGRDPKFRSKSNALFIPNGTYRLTKTLVVRSSLGPWLYGESRDGVVLKLDDGVKGVSCVLRTHPNESGPTSADWFMRNLRHFTIDVGNNPETDGIRYYATNTGSLQDVRIIGRGKIGLNAGFLDQSGPNLAQDITIEGFETGILSQWIWGQTLSRVTVKNCRRVGLSVSANVVAVEGLTVVNTPLAIENLVPNNWGHWGGTIALVGGRFSGGSLVGPAIQNASTLYARDVTARGFSQVLASTTERGSLSGQTLTEYFSFPGKRLFDGTPERSLGLPIRPEPQVSWENNSKKWLCVDDFGAVAGDNRDDTEAIERTLQAAARQKKTTVYFRGCGKGDPNWFTLSRRLRVPRPVRRILGLGWARLLGESGGGFVVDDGSAPAVAFQNIDSFGGPPITLTNASTRGAMVVQSCGVHAIGQGRGPIFLTDVSGGLDLQAPGQSCWTRQFNPEGDSDTGLVRNRGGRLWCLGVKHEGRGVRYATLDGGQTEILGLFNYAGYPTETDLRPLFFISDAAFSVAGLREIAFESHTATIKVRERQGSEERSLDKKTEQGWIGWSLYRSQR